MFIARIKTLDFESVDSVLKGALRKVILTIRRENTLNRIPPGSRYVYEEPIVRYRNHLIPRFSGLPLGGRDFLSRKTSSQRNLPADDQVLRQERRSTYVGALGLAAVSCQGVTSPFVLFRPKAVHGRGSAPGRAINDEMSANMRRGAATSAI